MLLLLFRLHMNREIGFSRSLWGLRTFPSGNFRLSFSGSLRDLDLENLKAGETVYLICKVCNTLDRVFKTLLTRFNNHFLTLSRT